VLGLPNVVTQGETIEEVTVMARRPSRHADTLVKVGEEKICTDGLLPELIQHWPPPSEVDMASKEEVIKAALIRVADTYASNEIVWPAQIDGELQPPPRSHIVDWVVREYVLGSADDEIRNRSLLRPTAMTVEVKVASLPTCQGCRLRPARYDTALGAVEEGVWGYLCSDCYPERGRGSLGIGRGRYLLTWGEVDKPAIAAIERAVAHWEAAGVPPPQGRPWVD
jgi:hypothetical protein